MVTLWTPAFPLLWPHIIQTLLSTLTGFTLGVIIGVSLGVDDRGPSRVAYGVPIPLLGGFLVDFPTVAVVRFRAVFGSRHPPLPS